MNDFIKIIEKNKTIIIIALAALMFILFAISAVDIAGKAQAGGFKIIFDGKGLGFSRFLSVIILTVPLLVIVGNLVNLNLSGNLKKYFNAICFASGFTTCLLMAIVLPAYVTLTWGGWLYILLASVGTAVGCIELLKK